MHQKKSKSIFIYLFFFVFLGTINNQKIINLNLFEVKNFQISGLDNNKIQLENKIYKITDSKIFFIDKNLFTSLLNSNSLIESFYVFKIYPTTLKIKIKKTNFLARSNINGEIFLIGSNGKLTKDFASSKSEELPLIFGSPDVEKFSKIFFIINNSKIEYENIKNIFFYKSGRVDLEMKSNILLKLPISNLMNVLNNISQLLSNDQFKKKIIDARVPNQIILYD